MRLRQKRRASTNALDAASRGWNKRYAPAACASGSVANNNIAGRYVQPDKGFAVKGVPEKFAGFQPGTWPALTLSPRYAYQGMYCLRLSSPTSVSEARRWG